MNNTGHIIQVFIQPAIIHLKFYGSELNILNPHASSIMYIFTTKDEKHYFSVHMSIPTFYVI